MPKKYAFLFALVFAAAVAEAQVLFDNTYTNIHQIATAIEANDGGIIVAATSNAMGSEDMCLLKTDAAGNTQWIKTYGNGSEDEYGKAVIQTSDGGYAFVGMRLNAHAFFVKTDAAGVTQWQYKYDIGYGNGFHDVYQLADSSYIVSYGATNTTYLPGFCRIDKNGTILWHKQFYIINTSGSQMHNLLPLPNGDFLVVGRVSLSSSSSYEMAMRFDNAGTIVWAKRYSSNGDFMDACLASDGNVVISGYEATARSTKIDLNGNVLWRHNYSFSTTPVAHSVVENASGELLFLLKCADAAYPAVIVKTNAAGGIIASRELTHFTYPSSFNATLKATIRPVSDGSFVVGVERHLKKITADLVSSCGIATVNVTDATASVSSGNYTPAPVGSTSLISSGFIEIPLTTVVTSNCSTIILSASTTHTDPLCNGQCTGTASVTAAGGQSPYTYLWSPGGQTTASVSALCAGTYTVAVTDANSSVVTSVVTITEPAAITANASATSPAFCIGSCTDLNISATGGTPGYTYSWMPGGMTGASPNVCPSATTTYTVTVTDANSCAQTGTATVTVHALPLIAASGAGAACEGESECLAASGGSAYAWSGPCGFSSAQQNPCISLIAGCGGAYIVTGTDTNGCSASDTVNVIVNSLPLVSYVESQTTACVNWTPVTLSVGSPAGGTYSGTAVTGNSFDPAAAGTGTHDIVYTYTDANGCTASDTSQVTVDLCTNAPGISSARSPVDAYPNPFGGSIDITGLLPGTEVQLVNLLGETVIALKAASPHCRLSTGELPAGTYFILARNDGTITVRKVIKQ